MIYRGGNSCPRASLSSGAVSSPRAAVFRRKVLRWYAVNGRHFPWRNPSASNYIKLVSEVLLQRTRAETVAAFLPAFLRRYPSWRRLASANRRQLEGALKPLGLYKRRAASLAVLAKEMHRRRGRFPGEREDIENLAGVGQYIANAVELFVFRRPTPLLDVNMARVLERYFGPRQLADIRYDPYLQRLAQTVVNSPVPRFVNWAILDLAAIVCLVRTPHCDTCPLMRGCTYRSSSTTLTPTTSHRGRV